MHTSIHYTQKVGKYFKLFARIQYFWMSDSPKKPTTFYKSPTFFLTAQSSQNRVLNCEAHRFTIPGGQDPCLSP